MDITITTLVDLLTTFIYFTSPTVALDRDIPNNVAGEQIVFGGSGKLTLVEYTRMPCPLKIPNYVTIYDKRGNICVYIPPEELIKLPTE